MYVLIAEEPSLYGLKLHILILPSVDQPLPWSM